MGGGQWSPTTHHLQPTTSNPQIQAVMTSTTEAPSQAAPKQFIEGIGPLAAVSLVVGTMIGSGIFIVSADIGRQVDAWGPGALMIVWVVTGLMTVTGALAYAELAAMIPKAGGQYIFLRDGLSPLIGFLFGWTLFAVIQTGTIAAVAVAFGKFLSVLIPGVTPDVFLSLGHLQMPGGPIEIGVSYQRLVALGVVLVLTVLNARGVTLGAQIQTVFAVAKVGALSVLILLGLTVLRRPEIAALNFSNFWGTGSWSLAVLPVLGAAMVGSLFSADAWNNVTFAAAEVQNPRRNLPLALGVGNRHGVAALCARQCGVPQPAPFHGDPNGVDTIARGIQHAAQDRVGVAAAEVMFGPIGAVLMAIAIMLSTFGCVNGLVLAGPRVYYADGEGRALLPQGWGAAPDLPHPRIRARRPGGLGHAALPERHLQRAPDLRHLCVSALLLLYDAGVVPPSSHPA